MKIDLSPKAIAVLSKIHDAHFEAYVVGGFVRDALLNRESYDIDIATNAKPHDIEKIFKDYTCSLVGKKHGTIGVLYDDEWFEITSYRSEQAYSDYRRPDGVSFVSSLSEDLIRRDFTINALALNIKGEIIDLVNGELDLRDKRIRCVGDPDKRFKEDALRMLRALRLAAQLKFEIEDNTAIAIHKDAALIQMIAIERVVIEFHKILQAEESAKIIYEFKDVIKLFLPEIGLLSEEEILLIDKAQNMHQKSLIIYSKSVKDDLVLSLKYLRHSNQFIQTLLKERELLDIIPKDLLDVKRLCSKNDFDLVIDSLYVQKLLNINDNALTLIDLVREIKEKDMCISLKQLDIRGQDLFDLGLKEKQISDMLNLLLDEVMQGNLHNKKEVLLTFVQKVKP